ncbi:MAG: hypothetical protein Q9200_005713 [Gallowayella weberi]
MSACDYIPDFKTNANGSHAQSSTVRQKTTQRQTVVVHNTMTATATEDWILFGDDTVTVKHSSIRKRKAENIYSVSHVNGNSRKARVTGPTMPPTPPGSSPAVDYSEKKDDRELRSAGKAFEQTHGRPTLGRLPPHELEDSRNLARGSSSYRLPTPDLSDVEEDEMWACCSGHSPPQQAPHCR